MDTADRDRIREKRDEYEAQRKTVAQQARAQLARLTGAVEALDAVLGESEGEGTTAQGVPTAANQTEAPRA